ncbi:cyclin-dependent kinase 14 [Cricetulus griseus]|nr:cyclin-dependent kinase 14 [Cricetulus griseus]
MFKAVVVFKSFSDDAGSEHTENQQQQKGQPIRDMRGVGCIFVEMIQGVAAFPGMKDIQDQLERIFLATGYFLCSPSFLPLCTSKFTDVSDWKTESDSSSHSNPKIDTDLAQNLQCLFLKPHYIDIGQHHISHVAFILDNPPLISTDNQNAFS